LEKPSSGARNSKKAIALANGLPCHPKRAIDKYIITFKPSRKNRDRVLITIGAGIELVLGDTGAIRER